MKTTLILFGVWAAALVTIPLAVIPHIESRLTQDTQHLYELRNKMLMENGSLGKTY